MAGAGARVGGHRAIGTGLGAPGAARSAARGNYRIEGAYSIQRGYDPPARHRTRPDEAVMKPSAGIVLSRRRSAARPGARAPGGSSVHAPACADGGERLHAEIRSRGRLGFAALEAASSIVHAIGYLYL